MSIKTVSLIGLPIDCNSSYLAGCAEAPEALRGMMKSGMSNLTAENGYDLENSDFCDLGNLNLNNSKEDFESIKTAASANFSKGPCLFIGGDHSVSWPIVEALVEQRQKGVHLVHVDAHPDLYPDFENNPFSHASSMARLLEQKSLTTLTQIGLRTINEQQRIQAEKYGVKQFPAGKRIPQNDQLPTGDVYLSIDLDCLDPAYAPGVSHHEPGGMTVREVIELIWNIPGTLIGADIVEYNPSRDINDMTAAVLLKFVKEVTAKMISDQK